MGLGKLLLQAFLQFPNLRHCVGVEVSPSRFAVAETAALGLAQLFPKKYRIADRFVTLVLGAQRPIVAYSNRFTHIVLDV